MRNLASFLTSLNYEPFAFENVSTYPNAKTNFLCKNDRPCHRQVWWSWVYAPVRTVWQKCSIPKIARRKRAKSAITQPWIIRFRSNFVESLNAWYPKCYKSLRSNGQRSRSQCDITCAKIRKIINNSAGDCLISLKFRTDFVVPQTFKVSWSKVKVTAWHSISASKTL